MPIYEYQCQCCGEITEKIEKSCKKFIICPKCNHISCRIISTTNFKVNGYNAKNLYSKTPKRDFIEQGPYDFERNLKKQGHRTANDILNK